MLRLFRFVYLWLSDWWHDRDFHLLGAAVPALLCGLTGVGITAAALAMPQQDREANYLREARRRFQAGDYAGALTCYDRLQSREEGRPEVLYGLALASEALGQPHRAVQIMEQLAPADRQGYAPAHLWWGRQLLRTPNATSAVWQAAEAHLLRALEGELEDRSEAEALLGQLYLNLGKFDRAEPYLQRAASERPQLRLALARLYAAQGAREPARAEARQALEYFRGAAQLDLHDHQARLLWAEAALFLEDFAGTVSILREGLTGTAASLYRPALAKAFVAWADHLAADPKASPTDRLALLEQALRYDPSHPDLIMQLWAFTKAKTEAADKARETLHDLLATGKATGLVHLALGMDAWDRGQSDQALFHLEQAYRLAPHLGVVANNLAWVLANSHPPDLTRALSLINSVLERWPNDPMLRDTRAFILGKQGKWKEALADLQVALPAVAERPEIHHRLAEAYDQLHMPEMADRHRQLAKSKAAAQPSAYKK